MTGAAGFIGSHLCRELSLQANEVIAIDNLSDYYDTSLKKARIKNLLDSKGISFSELDICNRSALNALIKESRPDVVVNLAAQAGVRLPLSQVYKYVESNSVGFSNVLQSTVSNKVPYFLYASSSSVYGDQAAIPYTESEQNLHPNSFYGATKLANELLTPTLVKNSATVARGLRFFSVYGPWGRPDMAYFRIIASAINDSHFELFGDGTVERDFTYIDDVVRSIIFLIDELKKHKFGFTDLVNLGGGNPTSINTLIEIIEKVSNKRVNLSKEISNSADVKKTMSNDKYLKLLIGKGPYTNIMEGITKTISWANENCIKTNLNQWII